MNENIKLFVDEKSQDTSVKGIILFGSWARGNNRPDSDVDLIIILDQGFKRTVEYFNNQSFEITYTTAESAIKYWNENKDDCNALWDIAKILYDKDDTVLKLKDSAEELLKVGKDKLPQVKVEHLKFDLSDQIEAAKRLFNDDPTTANLLLTSKLTSLTELYFDIRQIWTPPPKQRLSVIKGLSKEFFNLITEFCKITDFNRKIQIVHKASDLTFSNQHRSIGMP